MNGRNLRFRHGWKATEALPLQIPLLPLSFAKKKEAQRNRQGGLGTEIFEKSKAFFQRFLSPSPLVPPHPKGRGRTPHNRGDVTSPFLQASLQLLSVGTPTEMDGTSRNGCWCVRVQNAISVPFRSTAGASPRPTVFIIPPLHEPKRVTPLKRSPTRSGWRMI